MNQDLGLKILGEVMRWDDGRSRQEFRWLRLMARLKYDGYRDFQAGMRFIESLITWLQQFKPSEREEVGGSLLVLSPLGSKVMALGALMAALERDLPVAHLESIGYSLDAAVPATTDASNLVHIWLEGDAYPQPRPALAPKE